MNTLLYSQLDFYLSCESSEDSLDFFLYGNFKNNNVEILKRIINN